MKVETVTEGVQTEAGTSLTIVGDGIGRLGAKALRKVDITKQGPAACKSAFPGGRSKIRS